MHIKIASALVSSQDTVWLVVTSAPNGGAKDEIRPLVWSSAQASPAFPSPEPVGGRLSPLVQYHPLHTASDTLWLCHAFIEVKPFCI